VVASSSTGSGSFGVARRISSQASNVCACDSDPAVTHSFVEKTVEKITDLMLTVPLGCPAWQADNLEPLILVISLPFIEIFPLAFQEHFDYQ
jgi:hypothetical protein